MVTRGDARQAAAEQRLKALGIKTAAAAARQLIAGLPSWSRR
jgi:hypothetical protein